MPGQAFLNNLRSWLFRVQKAAPKELQPLQALPLSLQAVLTDQLEELSIPSLYYTELCEVIADRVKNWQYNEDVANNLVILGSPVEPIPKIVSTAIQNLQIEQLQIVELFPWSTRPAHPSTITQDLQQALRENYPELASHDRDVLEVDEDDLVKRRTLFVIPDLSQCFLRSINGWQSIEFLRDTVIHDSSYFWLIGCNSWSWQFLDHVCRISAYLEQTQLLPTIEPEVLREWLNPVVELVLPIKNEDSNKNLKYWETLTKKSLGFSQTAVALWLHSLRIPDDQLQQLPRNQLEIKLPLPYEFEIQSVDPNLPSLPELQAIDLYLLHSILIHGKISRPHLALSFGEPESVIRDRVQILLRTGIIKQEKNLLKVHPSHYPKLRTELENNNFLVGNEI